MLTTFYHLQSLLTSIYSKSGGISEIKEIMMLKKNVKKDTQSHFSQMTCSNLPRNVQKLVDAILLVSSLTPIKSIILDRFKHHYFHPNFITRHVLTCQEIYESYVKASKGVIFF